MNDLTKFEIGFIIGCMISIEAICEGKEKQTAISIREKMQRKIKELDKD